MCRNPLAVSSIELIPAAADSAARRGRTNVAIAKDLGDVTLTVRIGFGLKFQYAHDSDEEEARRAALSEKLAEFNSSDGIQALEQSLVAQVMKALDYTEESVAAEIERRDSQRKASRAEEDAGRAARQRRRVIGR